MLDEQHADPALVGEPAQQLTEGARLVLVEPGGRFVEEQHRRFGRQRAGDRDRAALTIGQALGLDVEHVCQAHVPDRPRHPRRQLVVAGADEVEQPGQPVVRVSRREQVLPDGHVVEELKGLEGAAQSFPGAQVRAERADVAAAQGDRSCGRLGVARHRVDQCRFAGAVRSEDPDHGGRWDREVDVVERDDPTEANRDVADLQCSGRDGACVPRVAQRYGRPARRHDTVPEQAGPELAGDGDVASRQPVRRAQEQQKQQDAADEREVLLDAVERLGEHESSDARGGDRRAVERPRDVADTTDDGEGQDRDRGEGVEQRRVLDGGEAERVEDATEPRYRGAEAERVELRLYDRDAQRCRRPFVGAHHE